MRYLFLSGQRKIRVEFTRGFPFSWFTDQADEVHVFGLGHQLRDKEPHAPFGAMDRNGNHATPSMSRAISFFRVPSKNWTR